MTIVNFDDKRPIDEEGQIEWYDVGLFTVRWLYNKHVIQLRMQNSWLNPLIDDQRESSITILYNDVDITDKYIDFIEDKPIKIRSTLENLMLITRLIDENMEDYELFKEEVTL